MKFSDLLYISLQNFRNRKSRVFFTVLGVAIAIAVVLSLVSFGYGLQRNLLNQITTEESLLALDILPSDAEVIRLTPALIEQIAKLPGVDEVSPEAVLRGQAAYEGTISETSINVVHPDYFALDGKSPLIGSFPGESDVKKIVISSTVASLFALDGAEALGKKLRLTAYISDDQGDSAVVREAQLGADYEIAAVVEGSSGTGNIYVLEHGLPQLQIPAYQYAKVKVASQGDMESVRTNLINAGFIVSSLSDVVEQANKIFNAIQIALGTFGVFALIVAAIGLVNTMTISLLERTNEIGIMRAIGASPRDIWKIFLGESVLIGFLGGLFGIILGVIGSELLNWLFDLLAAALGGQGTRLFAYPFWFIVFIMAVSTLVGLAGGIWPARRAARLNPLQALRYK